MIKELKAMLRKLILLNTAYFFIIPIFGYILLNLTFILDYAFQSLIIRLIRFFTPFDLMKNTNWFPVVLHFSFVFLLALISRSIFKSKIKTIYKATFFVVPLAVLYVTIGMFMYRWPFISLSLALYLFTGTFYYLIKKRLSWLYGYSLILISVVLLIFNLLGGEI